MQYISSSLISWIWHFIKLFFKYYPTYLLMKYWNSPSSVVCTQYEQSGSCLDSTTIVDCIMLLSRVEKIECEDQSYVLKAALKSDEQGLLVKDQHRKSKKFKLEILLITQFVGAASLFFFLLRNEAVQWGVMWTTWTAVIWATCAFIASCILLRAMVVIFWDGYDAITPKVHNGVRGPGKYLVPALSGYPPVSKTDSI